MLGNRKELRALAKLKSLVIHPLDDDGKVLMQQLNRVGCHATQVWPEPKNIPEDIDIVFFLLDYERALNWSSFDDERNFTLIALLDYENSKMLEALVNANVQGLITKPIRPFGILAHLINARSLFQYEKRLLNRISKLDSNLRSRRKVEKAAKLIADKYDLTEEEAYTAIRKEAMNKQVTLEVMAESVICVDEFIGGKETNKSKK
ncbi:MAG: ANTAR domain-containing response regulator [Cellvibrionaceae bacterium]